MNLLRTCIREMLAEISLGQGYGIKYTALVLDPLHEGTKMLKAMVPQGWTPYGHHMTIINPTNQNRRLPGRWLGAKLCFKVTGIAQGPMVMTALVDLGNTPLPMRGNVYPHVTIATNPPDGKPEMSKWKFEPVIGDKSNQFKVPKSGPFVICGTIEEIMR